MRGEPRSRRFIGRLLAFTSLALASVLGGCQGACSGASEGTSMASSLGSPARGRQLLTTYGCGTCHVIPGVDGAQASVGPPLTGFGRRVYAGGRLNTPTHLVRFLMNPKYADPSNPMPIVGVTEAEAYDLAAFLYTLQ